MKSFQWRTVFLSCVHFAVDFSCAFLLYRRFAADAQIATVILLYNFFAFALQLPLGILADQLGRPERFAALGCLLCGAAYAFPSAIIAAVVAGIGNALFHVGGGCEVMDASPEHAAPLGVFVSPGAFGIYFGMLLGQNGGLPFLLLPVLMAALGILCLFSGARIQRDNDVAFPVNIGEGFCILAIFVVVLLRSYGGFAMAFPWRTGILAFAAVAATVLGKTVGGFLSDQVGLRWGGVISLLGAGVLFLFSAHPVSGLLGIFLFNLTMPMTLFALAKRLPTHRGACFGLLTFALFLGFLPKYFGLPAPLSTGALLMSVSLGSLLVYLPAAERRET